MSGIYIPGMEMPNGGYRTVEIAFDADGYPMALADGGDAFDVIPVPPHGRLIDADALIANHFSDEHRIAMSYADKCWMRRIINGEQTILPAEGGEKV